MFQNKTYFLAKTRPYRGCLWFSLYPIIISVNFSIVDLLFSQRIRRSMPFAGFGTEIYFHKDTHFLQLEKWQHVANARLTFPIRNLALSGCSNGRWNGFKKKFSTIIPCLFRRHIREFDQYLLLLLCFDGGARLTWRLVILLDGGTAKSKK